MKGIRTWVLDHKLLVGVFLLLAQPLLVHLFLLIPAPFRFLERTWDAGDLITYIAGCEAFIGTVYLGSIAAKQNKQSIDINNRLLQIEEINSRFQHYPNIKIDTTSITQTVMSEIKNPDSIILCRKGCREDVLITPAFINRRFNLLTFVLENKSNFNINIYIKSLVLKLPNQTCIDYDTNPLALIVNNFIISPNGNLQLNVIVDDSDVLFNELLTISTEIVVENNVGKKFLYSIDFLLLLTEKNHLFKVLTEKTSSMD